MVDLNTTTSNQLILGCSPGDFSPASAPAHSPSPYPALLLAFPTVDQPPLDSRLPSTTPL
ncbi:hypothetical protein PGT21_003301 [Puccinia graminis f. sp. tritici]|uniref:Uncharacterized protein n=1 Tax=Puccinia graminis f. sp. tritici TaxID=56615 RepID=A0A5B0M5M5_PUCGR|nr:hypothetical protein PGT21_003301 [Puccinia graminis f. sp. tritici]